MTYLKLQDIAFSYPRSKTRQLDGFNLEVEAGSCTALVGPSGCAKTTVLRLIAGLERPLEGEILLDGQVLAKQGRFIEPEQRDIGLIFQDYALFPHMSVLKNVLYGLAKLPRKERLSRAQEALELVGMTDFKKRFPWQLSGGQQQRVAVARALAPRPRLLLLDEPFSNLDADLRAHVRKEIKEILTTANMTSVLVTHDEADAKALADKTVAMPAP
ncbi:ABC transporter ATP-binding protein [Corynebacterium caspium]|uniref:ABC transporter ATP-binding protein n=1 Tax=Corynebacterium caspium TaxID=234828 RepID=UPI00036642EE|nr:ATP-binding cassette domain-containing protein [Corynebacterium caspium]WKD59537.1 Sulfate/thiosulfate import ATP-binding protein CysA [Corynebacterium caspium DSM 44850]